MPFALGLLVARELQDEIRKPHRNAAEVLDGIVEEVQGFDLVGDALRAAVGIACFEANFPAQGRAALISAWLEVQNVPESAYEALVAYTTACPEAVLDCIEVAFDVRASARRRQWLTSALLDTRDRPKVCSSLQPRVSKWLARWSRKPRRLGHLDEKEEDRLRESSQKIADRLNALTSTERAFLIKVCEEVDSPETMQLDAVAALLMAGQPQAAYAEAVLAWAFVGALTGDFRRADTDLSWAIRLNRQDYAEFEASLCQAVDTLLQAPFSEVGRSAAAVALRILGTPKNAANADHLSPRQVFQGWRLVEKYCETDPFDPTAARPTNLINAINEAAMVDPAKVWLYMSVSEEDHKLEWITPGLARFEPNIIIALYRDIAKTAQTRNQLSLRQISWRLQQLSPLFDESTLTSVLGGYERLVQRPSLVPAADQRHVAGSILLSLLPHFDSPRQLQLFLKLPIEVPDWYAFRDVFAPLSATELEVALSEAEGHPIKLRRTLFFASAHRPELTERTREMVGRALTRFDLQVVTCASEVAYYAQDEKIDELIITAARQRGSSADCSDEAFWRARAVAAATVSNKRVEDIGLVAPRFVSFVAERLGGMLYQKMVADIDSSIERLLSPIQATEPLNGQLFIDVGRTGQGSLRRIEDRTDEGGQGSIEKLQDHLKKLAEPEQEIDEFAERRKALQKEAKTYLEQLSAEGAQALAAEPDIGALKRVAKQDPSKAAAWANRILTETEGPRVTTIRNLALGLAEAIAESDPKTAAALLVHVSKFRSPVTIVRGDARIPQEIIALFTGPDIEPLSTLRCTALDQALSDSDIETLVFAAESSGHSTWLRQWVDREVSSVVPGQIARALTVAGLCDETTGMSSLLTRDWGTGFLGQVAERARYAYDRNRWARSWAAQVSKATDPADFWRWGELTVGIADVRAFHWFDPNLDIPMMQRFGSELFKRVQKAAENRTKKRRDKLFGLKNPKPH